MDDDRLLANDSSTSCRNCQSSFGIFNRKHHCRLCGYIYCDKCTAQKVVLPDIYGTIGPQRVCDPCADRANGKITMSSSGGGEKQKRGVKDIGVDDLVMLSKVSESEILENLKKRFNNDFIYTYIGHVLISVNPFKMIQNLYSDRTLSDYKGKFPYELPPHVFSLADQMYKQMRNEGENHCVIISGESGAGKTEASKRILQFIAAVSGSSPDVTRVKNVILESNPLLESFGNAKTIRNNNSSRFGKYMEIQFNRSGDPEGGCITNYLLEKSRVCTRSQDERSFHVFYQILQGLPADFQRELGVSGLTPKSFAYLTLSNCYEVSGIDDKEEFNDMLKAMNTMNITRQQQLEVFRLLLSILYLGNFTFKETGADQSTINSKDALNTFAKLFQVDTSLVEKAFCFRVMSTGTEGRSARVSVYNVPQNVDGAMYSRDAMAKALYSRLFDWIIHKVNESMYVNDPEACLIGVLDIYGFEIFENNSFEQFCINYVNEKLQQIFIQLTLKAEQEEYHAEGIKWENIDYFNNKICCDLVESKKPLGLMAILDDTCNFPKGTDEKFHQKISSEIKDHAHLQIPGPNYFTIKHYAGDVTYNVAGFCDKNKDLLYNDLIELAQFSQSSFIRDLFPETTSKDDKKRPTTAGFKIKESIGELVTALSACVPHYIRCIKPNEKKQAGNFDNAMCMHQVRYLGLLENVRVRRAGYAFRAPYERFYYRYRVCSSKTWPSWSGDAKSATSAILDSITLENKEFQLGTSKIFIRHPETVFALEELRERKVWSYATTIQDFFKQITGSGAQYELMMGALRKVQGKKERRRNSLDRYYNGDYINLRDNLTLKAITERYGEDKIVFADNINHFDIKCNSNRRIILVTEKALYTIGILALTQDKKAPIVQTAANNPFKYVLTRRIELAQIGSISLSTLADNLLVIHVQQQHDIILDCRRKTELLEMITRQQTSIRYEFQQSIPVNVKDKKKTVKKVLVFEKNEAGAGVPVNYKVPVPSGLASSTTPNIKEPVKCKPITGLTTPLENKPIPTAKRAGGGARPPPAAAAEPPQAGRGRGRGRAAAPPPSHAAAPEPSPRASVPAPERSAPAPAPAPAGRAPPGRMPPGRGNLPIPVGRGPPPRGPPPR